MEDTTESPPATAIEGKPWTRRKTRIRHFRGKRSSPQGGTTLARQQGQSGRSRGRCGRPRLVHELQVHQIELEMQNEELQRAQAAAEEASEKY